MTDTQSRPAGPPVGTDDELCHQVCCEDENRALCGRDMAGAAWKRPGAKTFDCVVCDDLNLNKYCPRHAICRGCVH